MDDATIAPATAYQPLDWKPVKSEAARVGVSPRALLRACASGECEAVRVNDRGDVRVLPEWVDRWMLAKKAANQARHHRECDL